MTKGSKFKISHLKSFFSILFLTAKLNPICESHLGRRIGNNSTNVCDTSFANRCLESGVMFRKKNAK